MPPGGEGFYYFSTYLLVQDAEYGRFAIQFNGVSICYAHAQQTGTTTDEINTSCSAVLYGTEGKKFNFLSPFQCFDNFLVTLEIGPYWYLLSFCMIIIPYQQMSITKILTQNSQIFY